MATNSRLSFDDIHTKEKQERLESEMMKVAETIHARFGLSSREAACPCCRSNALEFHVEKYGFSIDRCRDCNHIFTNPFPSVAALNYYYNSDFKNFENKIFLDSFEKRIPIFLHRISLIREQGIKGNILDVGAAIGLFCEANIRSGSPFNVTACDLNESACQRLREIYPAMTVICADINDVAVGNYSCVTLWDTFEHIPDPTRVLTNIRNVLAPGGYLVLSTPNTDSYEWSAAGKDHVQVLPPGHVNLYNKNNIETVLKRCKFEVCAIHTPNPSLDITYVSKLLDKQGIDESLYSSRVGAVFHNLLRDEAFFNLVCDDFRRRRFAGNMVVISRATS